MKMIVYYVVRMTNSGYCDYVSGPFGSFNQAYNDETYQNSTSKTISIVENELEVTL